MSSQDQEVKITLKEYLEYQELKQHKKEVVIVETIDHLKNGEHISKGSSITWKSDGKCWVSLASKLERCNEKRTYLIKENKSWKEILKKMKKNNSLIKYFYLKKMLNEIDNSLLE